MRRIPYLLSLLSLIIALTLVSCGSTKGLHSGTSDATGDASAVRYARQVIATSPSVKAITAHAKVRLQAMDKDITLNGNLRMMRDDVIQLSVSMLGFEIGRMEFTKDEVLIVDRAHRRYVRVPYSEVDFLQSTSLDFSSLQAIFWHQLFAPGTQDVSTALSLFTKAESGGHTLLSLKSAPKLEYAFLTQTASQLIDRTTISPKSVTESGEFVCKYGAYTKLAGKQFPTSLELSFKGEGNTAKLSLQLSSLGTKTDWPTRTELSSKYTRMDARNILKKIMSE